MNIFIPRQLKKILTVLLSHTTTIHLIIYIRVCSNEVHHLQRSLCY
jgi:hypothetical protein